MNRIKVSFRAKLLASFSGILLIFFMFGSYGLLHEEELIEKIEIIYEHPLPVTRAVLKANVAIVAMHRSMKDVVLATNNKELEQAISKVNQFEKEALAEFDIVQSKILGAKGQQLASVARASLIRWREIRSEVIELMRSGKRKEAVAITKGKGAEYVESLSKSQQNLWKYADNKATTFYNESLELHDASRFVYLVFLTSSIALTILLTIIISFSLSKRVARLSQASGKIANGDLSVEVEVEGLDEIADLAENFNLMTSKLATSLVSISKHEKVEEQLQRTNRSLRMLRDCNQTLARSENEPELLTKMCEIIVEEGGYCLTWVGLTGHDEAKSVHPVASYGFEEGYLDTLDITWDNTERGRGPAGTAIRTGVPYIAKNILIDPDCELWREEALKRGYKSSAAFPLVTHGLVIGALNVFSCEAEAFDEKEISLLKELAGDMAYGVEALRTREERNRATEELLRFKQIVSNSQDLMALLDRNFSYLAANPAYINAFGKTKKELIGRTAADAFGEEFFETIIKPNAERCLGGEEINSQTWVDFPVQGRRYMEITYSPYISGKQVKGFVVNARNITERKRAEDAVRENEARLKAITSSTSNAIIMIGSEAEVMFWNEAAGHMFGYSSNEVIGNKLTDFIIPNKYQEGHIEGLAEFKKTGEGPIIGTTIELSAINKDGNEFPIELTLSSVKMRDKWLAVGIIHDITERKRMEDKLRRSDLMLNKAQEIAHIGSWEFDLINNKAYWSKEFYRIYGLEQGSIYPSYEAFLSFIHPADRGKFSSFKDSPPEEGKTCEIELRFIRPDGVERVILNKYSVELDDAGKPARLSGVNMDVTERKLSEEKLRKSHEELEEALVNLEKTQKMLIRAEKLASMGELSAGVAHEIKNPLNIISTAVQLLKMDDNVMEEALDSYNTILGQVNRAVKITENLRAFARERKPEIEDIELNGFIEKIVSLVEYEMKVENIEFEKYFASPRMIIRGDEDQLAQVFLNIINNARDSMNEMQMKYSYEELQKEGWKGQIIINVETQEPSAVVRFKDTGMGMSQNTLSKLFDPFFTTKEEGKGTGLGLSIAYGIIENHNGTIEAVSEEGKGSEITVRLPLSL